MNVIVNIISRDVTNVNIMAVLSLPRNVLRNRREEGVGDRSPTSLEHVPSLPKLYEIVEIV